MTHKEIVDYLNNYEKKKRKRRMFLIIGYIIFLISYGFLVYDFVKTQINTYEKKEIRVPFGLD